MVPEDAKRALLHPVAVATDLAASCASAAPPFSFPMGGGGFTPPFSYEAVYFSFLGRRHKGNNEGDDARWGRTIDRLDGDEIQEGSHGVVTVFVSV